MKTYLQYYIILILFAFNTYGFAQPGWSQIGGSLNDLSKSDIDNCLNSDCKIKYITINSGTDLNKLSILKDLESLALHFDLDKFPEEFSKLESLKYLIVISDKLKDISTLGKLKNLRHLTLLDYTKKQIPKGFQFLQNVEELEITGEFKNVAGIEDMIKLKKLSLSSKNLRCLPDFIVQNKVEELQLTKLQEKFNFRNLSLLPNLKVFSIYESSIIEFPNNLSKEVRKVTIWRAEKLTDIKNIELSNNLEKLSIYFTAIESLPSSNFLSKIQCLEISGNLNLKVSDKKYNVENCGGIYDNGKL